MVEVEEIVPVVFAEIEVIDELEVEEILLEVFV